MLRQVPGSAKLCTVEDECDTLVVVMDGEIKMGGVLDLPDLDCPLILPPQFCWLWLLLLTLRIELDDWKAWIEMGEVGAGEG